MKKPVLQISHFKSYFELISQVHAGRYIFDGSATRTSLLLRGLVYISIGALFLSHYFLQLININQAK
jgi:hypothetical protein